MTTDTPAAERPRRIWDVPTRLFHWLLVISIAASWATAELSDTMMQYHLWLGYWTLGLVIFRIVWGLIGSRHARFWSFLKGPLTTLRYAGSLFGGRHVEAPGHNPMGGWMVVILLGLVGAQAVTGLFADDDIVWAGPWAPAVDGATSSRLTGWHEFNFNLILAAVAAHVVAIAVYRFALGENLVGPMVTGRKSAERVAADAAIAGTPWLRALIAAALAGGAVYAVLAFAPPPVSSWEY